MGNGTPGNGNLKTAKLVTPAGVIEGYRAVPPMIERDGDVTTIDADGVYYRQLNEAVRAAAAEGAKTIEIVNVNGQRYIGAGMKAPKTHIEVRGIAGNDLAMFADGVDIEVFGNAQDGVGNTMSSGRVVVHGDAGDVIGYGMRGGRIFVQGDVGYRVGIHMKAYEKNIPVLVCGGKARDFFGEYMAGGLLVLLGMNARDADQPLVGSFVGAGMHGGMMFLRGSVESWQCGAEVGVSEATPEDMATLKPVLAEYAEVMGEDLEGILSATFTKLVPKSHRPYGNLYASL